MKDSIRELIDNHAQTIKELQKKTQTIEDIAKTVIACLTAGGKIMICGNGGSAADSQHMAAEFIGRFKKINRIPLPAIALTTDTSVITAIGNDFGINEIFSKQISALGNKNDILFTISTSGNSENLIKAISVAKKLQVKSVGLLGKDGGQLKNMVDQHLTVTSEDTARIQEAHSLIMHIICELVENSLLKKDSSQ